MTTFERIRTLIVDDEILAREKIRRFIQFHPELQIIGECSNGIEAVQSIRERRPHLIFLDVQLPGLSGYEIIQAIPSNLCPVIILVTAHLETLQRLPMESIVSVMLKPFDRDHFEETLQRAIKPWGSNLNLSLREIK